MNIWQVQWKRWKDTMKFPTSLNYISASYNVGCDPMKPQSRMCHRHSRHTKKLWWKVSCAQKPSKRLIQNKMCNECEVFLAAVTGLVAQLWLCKHSMLILHCTRHYPTNHQCMLPNTLAQIWDWCQELQCV